MDYRHVKVGRVSRPEITAVLASHRGRSAQACVHGVTGHREQRDGRLQTKTAHWSSVTSRSRSPWGESYGPLAPNA